MNLLQQSALAWKEITEYRYSLIYGYKKQLYERIHIPSGTSTILFNKLFPQ